MDIEMKSISDELMAKVVKQLEYYFSDVNLLYDYFLREKIQKDVNRWLSIETIMKCNRLNRLVDNNKDLVINALKNIKSDLIELNSSEDKIRRKSDQPLPQKSDQLVQSLNERTVHVKGFPEDVALEDLIQWSEQFGTVLSVQMSRLKTSRRFKGCAFIAFAEKSMADKVVDQSVLKFADKELLKESKLRYNERKLELKAEKKRLKCVDKKPNRNQSEEKSTQAVNPIGLESAVLKLTPVARRLSSDAVRSYFNAHSKVVFLRKHPNGSCFVRFANRLDAKKVLAVTKAKTESTETDKIVIDGIEATAQVLSGEEEKEFWILSNKMTEKVRKHKQRVKKRVNRKKRNNTCLNPNKTSDLKPKRLAQN